MCSKDPSFKKDKLTIYNEVYIGHTPTINLGSTLPLTFLEITNIDTGACYGGKLSLLNIDTKELYQSDVV
jgi:serine/threonine protein phosphatase 1